MYPLSSSKTMYQMECAKSSIALSCMARQAYISWSREGATDCCCQSTASTLWKKQSNSGMNTIAISQTECRVLGQGLSLQHAPGLEGKKSLHKAQHWSWSTGVEKREAGPQGTRQDVPSAQAQAA